MSELALQLIAENKRTRDTFLDLGNCGLTEIPAEVGELLWLESLSLASAWSEWNGRTEEEQHKKSKVSGDKNDRLTDDLAPLAGLSALQTLYVRGHAGHRPRAAGGPVCLAEARCLVHAGHRPCAAGGPVCPCRCLISRTRRSAILAPLALPALPLQTLI